MKNKTSADFADYAVERRRRKVGSVLVV